MTRAAGVPSKRRVACNWPLSASSRTCSAQKPGALEARDSAVLRLPCRTAAGVCRGLSPIKGSSHSRQSLNGLRTGMALQRPRAHVVLRSLSLQQQVAKGQRWGHTACDPHRKRSSAECQGGKGSPQVLRAMGRCQHEAAQYQPQVESSRRRSGRNDGVESDNDSCQEALAPAASPGRAHPCASNQRRQPAALAAPGSVTVASDLAPGKMLRLQSAQYAGRRRAAAAAPPGANEETPAINPRG